MYYLTKKATEDATRFAWSFVSPTLASRIEATTVTGPTLTPLAPFARRGMPVLVARNRDRNRQKAIGNIEMYQVLMKIIVIVIWIIAGWDRLLIIVAAFVDYFETSKTTSSTVAPCSMACVSSATLSSPSGATSDAPAEIFRSLTFSPLSQLMEADASSLAPCRELRPWLSLSYKESKVDYNCVDLEPQVHWYDE